MILENKLLIQEKPIIKNDLNDCIYDDLYINDSVSKRPKFRRNSLSLNFNRQSSGNADTILNKSTLTSDNTDINFNLSNILNEKNQILNDKQNEIYNLKQRLIQSELEISQKRPSSALETYKKAYAEGHNSRYKRVFNKEYKPYNF